ncbi:MAG: type II toxin-antitoxin system prevent-host-death family antitoxin [Deltaproteobacteria bacterium]|nr:type II toxin-antitoxin system prevent-host-death family antitoxin [Deltaproteobacteria bacterium]
MKTVTYTDAKKNLKALIHQVCEDSDPAVIIDSRTKERAVLISIEDFQAMEETAYLLNSPANRKHLERSLKQATEGKLVDYSSDDL